MINMLKNAVEKGMSFFKRQKSPYKVNLGRLLIQNFSFGLTQQYQSIYITELGATPLELGYANSLGGLASTFITIPVGWLADRYGMKKILLTGISIAAIGYALFGAAMSWQTTLLAIIVTTFATQMTRIVCPMICGSSLANVERTTGMQLCDTVSAIPRLGAPVVAAFLITMFGGLSVEGIRPLYWMEVVGLLVSGFIIYKFFVNPRHRGESEPPKLTSDLRRVFEEGVMVKRWLALTILSVIPMFMAIYVPLYARELKGATQYTIGFMDAAYYTLIVLLAIPLGISADRFGRKKLTMLLTPIYSVSLLLIIFAPNDLTLIVGGLLGGSIWLALVTEASLWVEAVPKDLLGSWSGMRGLLRGIMNIVSPILGGFLWKFVGPKYVLFFLAVSQIIKLPILATISSSSSTD